MADGEAPCRAPFGLSYLVALGWYVTLPVAVVAGWAGIPTEPRQDCSAMFSCLTGRDEFRLLLMVMVIAGVPVALGLLVVTLIVSALLARRVPSAFLIGSLSALSGVAVVAAVVAVRLAAR